jgi:hypothetical protein
MGYPNSPTHDNWPIMSAENNTAGRDYNLALQSVAGQMEQEGYVILGGSNSPNEAYSLVLQRAGTLTAVKVINARAPEEPAYHSDETKRLKEFAAQNGIGVCAMALVGLMSAGLSPEGEEGFYMKFEGLKIV